MKSLLLALALVPALAASAQPVVNHYAPPKNSSLLDTTYVDWDALNFRDTPNGSSSQVFDNPTGALDKLEVHISTLQPGKESHPVHRHPWEEMLLIKDGSVDVSINSKIQHAGPGDLVFLASNDPHNAKNVGTTPATYYVINFVTDLSHNEDAPSAAQQAVPGKLASTIIHSDSLATTPTRTGSRVVVVSSPTLTFQALESHITTLNAGQQTDRDIVDHNDEIVVIRSGKVEMTVNGIAGRLDAGSIVYWAPNVKRTIRNIGTTPASYQVFRVTSAKSPKS